MAVDAGVGAYEAVERLGVPGRAAGDQGLGGQDVEFGVGEDGRGRRGGRWRGHRAIDDGLGEAGRQASRCRSTN
ncbi:hypothetical protein [Streptomyces milbemycinicus]|uniref:hypothetical protein n=1 Tax=Streptomyces milbemycinicus TaxID=476552 RepID=UPI0033C42D84